MKEKLPLLSKTPFSPPNPKVSGGHFSPAAWSSLLHHGGCPLCHENPPLRHGGSVFRLCPCCLEVNIKISFTMSTPSPPPNARPPPEPPPSSLILISTSTEASPPGDLPPQLPDPKPPWLPNISVSLSTWFYSKNLSFMFVDALFSFRGRSMGKHQPHLPLSSTSCCSYCGYFGPSRDHA